MLMVTGESDPVRPENLDNRFEINSFVIYSCNKIMQYFLWFGKIEHDFKLCLKNHNMLTILSSPV